MDTLPLARSPLGRSGPNLEPGTMHVYVTNGPRNALNIGEKVGPCPGSRIRWVLGSVHAFSQAAHAAHTHRPRFQVRTRPPSSLLNHRLLGVGGHHGSRRTRTYIYMLPPPPPPPSPGVQPGIHLHPETRPCHHRGGAGQGP